MPKKTTFVRRLPMRSCAANVIVLMGIIQAGLVWAAEPEIKGNVILPSQAMVFAPFAREDGAPSTELLRSVPDTLVIGGKKAAGRPALFNSRRSLDCAPFCGREAGNTAWVYLAFTADTAGPTTFGFGADWWHEAWLDGKVISETLSRGDTGNEAWPPSICDYTATVELAKGPHILAVRVVRGSSSAIVTVGGPQDLRTPAIRSIPRFLSKSGAVTKAGYRDGPPCRKKMEAGLERGVQRKGARYRQVELADAGEMGLAGDQDQAGWGKHVPGRGRLAG